MSQDRHPGSPPAGQSSDQLSGQPSVQSFGQPDPVAVEPADRVAAATLAVPGVAALHAGAFGEVATYLPGRRVVGVRTGPGATAVHVTVAFGSDIRTVAEDVRASVGAVAPGEVQVVVDRRERDAHHRDVEAVEEDGTAEDEQRDPGAPVERRCGVGVKGHGQHHTTCMRIHCLNMH